MAIRFAGRVLERHSNDRDFTVIDSTQPPGGPESGLSLSRSSVSSMDRNALSPFLPIECAVSIEFLLAAMPLPPLGAGLVARQPVYKDR